MVHVLFYMKGYQWTLKDSGNYINLLQYLLLSEQARQPANPKVPTCPPESPPPSQTPTCTTTDAATITTPPAPVTHCRRRHTTRNKKPQV